MSSLMKAKKILKSFKPDVVVGTGGFASGPMLQVAAKNGIPNINTRTKFLCRNYQ
jgi:UDP-N-acetylglucosamine--N-acetylmuramyl-(pentapeptide) pyrophosphoryl-undecaprenol N-acetylglucosamine transferase